MYKLALAILLALPTMSKAGNDLECLAKNIYFEARGESLDGQLAVGHVTLNRVEDSRWPNTICGVVYQPSQFSWTRNSPRVHESEAWEIAEEMAKEAIESHEAGEDITDGAVYFARTRSSYFFAPLTVRIGNHSFFG